MKNYERTYSFEKRADSLLFKDLFALIKARSDEETRYFMMGIQVESEKNRIMATDGRRVHIIENTADLEDGFYTVLLATKTKIVISLDPDRGQFPNIDRVIPDIEKYSRIKLEKWNRGNGFALFYCQLIDKTNSYFSMPFIKDLPEGEYEIYFDPENDHKSVLLRQGKFTAVIMPLMKD